jgi:hypothetical protein
MTRTETTVTTPTPPPQRRIGRQIQNALVWLLAAAALLWIGDWVVWSVRVWRGGGYSTVQVDQYLQTPLKNHKMEYDHMGLIDQACVQSIFPHSGDNPCWWLRRHTTQWE